MTAYQSIRFADLRERDVQGELNEREKRQLAELYAIDRQEWEKAPQPRLLGGDYPDVF